MAQRAAAGKGKQAVDAVPPPEAAGPSGANGAEEAMGAEVDGLEEPF